MKKIITISLLIALFTSFISNAQETKFLEIPCMSIDVFQHGTKKNFDGGKVVFYTYFNKNRTNQMMFARCFVAPPANMIENMGFTIKDSSSFNPIQRSSDSQIKRYNDVLNYKDIHTIEQRGMVAESVTISFMKVGERGNTFVPRLIIVQFGWDGELSTVAFIKYSDATWNDLVQKVYGY